MKLFVYIILILKLFEYEWKYNSKPIEQNNLIVNFSSNCRKFSRLFEKINQIQFIKKFNNLFKKSYFLKRINTNSILLY
jgi:hypothetical protein